MTNRTARENITNPNANLEKLFALELLRRGTGEIALEAGSFIAIAVTAVLGNSFICLAMYKNKNLRRKVTNIFILSLAVSDILLSILCMPISAGILIRGRWLYSDFVCEFQAYWIYVLVGISLYTMTITAVNRFYRVVKPRSYVRYFSLRSTLMMILLVWLGNSMIIAIMVKIDWLHVKFQSAKASCVMYADLGSKTLTYSYQVIAFSVFFIIPTSLISWCYRKVFGKVREHQTTTTTALAASRATLKKLPNRRKNAKFRRNNSEEIDMTRTLFRVVLGFALCWTPVIFYEVVIIASNFFNFHDHLPRQVHLIWLYFGTIGSAVNAFIYGGMNRSFRNEFQKIFFFNCRKSQRVGIHTNEISVITYANTLRNKSGVVSNES